MAHLYLLRHAARAHEPSLDDFDQPLSDLGRREAEAMAAYMCERGIAPDVVLCSAANRARQTWDAIAPAMPPDTAARIDPTLYLASAGRLLESVRDVPDGVAGILVVAHNPGLQHLAAVLAADDAGHGPKPVVLPPCGLAILGSGTAAWRTLGPGGAEQVALVTPRDLGVHA